MSDERLTRDELICLIAVMKNSDRARPDFFFTALHAKLTKMLSATTPYDQGERDKPAGEGMRATMPSSDDLEAAMLAAVAEHMQSSSDYEEALLEAVTKAIAGIGDQHDMADRRFIADEIITIIREMQP